MTLKFDSRQLPRSFNEWEQLVLACGVQDDIATRGSRTPSLSGPIRSSPAGLSLALLRASR